MQSARVTGVNHMTLAVGDLARSIAFYRDLLGLDLRAQWENGAYLEAGTLWLCLSLNAATRTTPDADNTHLAFDVAADAYAPLCARILAAAPEWRESRSEGPSTYFLDPDGHKLELTVGSLAARLDYLRANPLPGQSVMT